MNIERNKADDRENVEYLIVSVGTSYEPIVLNISLLTPGKILFLYTEKSAPTLDKAVDYCDIAVKPEDSSYFLIKIVDHLFSDCSQQGKRGVKR